MPAIYTQYVITNKVVCIVRRDQRTIDFALVAYVFHTFVKLNALLTGWLAIDEKILRRLSVVVAH